ncbi:MAG: surface glycan-binding family protein [Candidatus Cryptobacteroides sp.]
MKNIPYILLSLAVPFCIFASSCQNEEPLQPEITAGVSYSTVNKVYPNKTFEYVPEIQAGKAENFAIQSVYFGETQWKGDMFDINPSTGVVTAVVPAEIATGDYLVSITCSVDGQKFILRNALTVTAIPGVPDVNIDESPKVLRYESLNPESTAAIPFVSVLIVNEASPVTSLEIRNVRKGNEPLEGGEALFAVDSDALTITPVRADSWVLGTYTADLKVNTESFSAESSEGLMKDALIFNVEALPVVLTYPEAGNFYQNQTATYTAKFEDAVPTDIAIKSVTVDGSPLADWSNLLGIDSDANVSVAAVPDAKVGEYKISVSYKYAGQDLSSDDVLCVKCIAGLPAALSSTDFGRLFEPAELAEGSAGIDGFRITAEGESAEVLSYSIAGASHNSAPFVWQDIISIADGVVNLAKGTWDEGEYSVDIRCVTASFDESYEHGVFNGAVKFSVYNAVELKYENATKKEHAPWSITPSTPMPSGFTYSFTDPAADYVSVLSLNPATGELTASKGNSLGIGTYDVSITASSPGRNPSTGVFELSVVQNPYYFTYFSYGNNLGLTEEESSGVSQFRLAKKAEIGTLKPEIQYTDLPESGKDAVTYSIDIKENMSSATIVSNTGDLSFTTDSWANFQNGLIFVTATTVDPEDAANSFTVKIPVFFHFANMNPTSSGRNVSYTPFVLRVNPRKGGKTSSKPVITGVEDESKFLLDLRRDFCFWTLDDNENLNSYKSIAEGQLLYTLWTQYDWGGVATNYGSNNPVSYFTNGFAGPKNQEQLAKSLAYFDNANDFSVVVNADMWIDKSTDYAANGVFICQTATTDDGEPASLGQSYDATNNPNCAVGRPIIIWLDPNFE